MLSSKQYDLEMNCGFCPACTKPILTRAKMTQVNPLGTEITGSSAELLWPDAVERPVPHEVESEAPEVAKDFREAVAVLPKSRRASAALARRCLQQILTTKGGATGSKLAKQIDQVLDKLPPSLAENVDAIRQIGNFAAHPIKSEKTGEITEVEPQEAEWLLEVLEDLFDFYYVGPARAKVRREALNNKLQDSGKPPLKSPTSKDVAAASDTDQS